MTKAFATVAAGLLLTGQGASAQNVPTPLEILIESTDDVSRACGITEELQRSAVRTAMRANRIAEAASAPENTVVYVNVGTMQHGTICISNVRLEIKNYRIGQPPGMEPIIAGVVFCSEGGLLSGDEQARRVSDLITRYFNQCLSEIADNYNLSKAKSLRL